MRQLFTDRKRLVVYMEAADLVALEQHARGQGHTLAEWARETLLGQLAHRELPKAKIVWPLEAPMHTSIVSGDGMPTANVRCTHGVSPGDLCYRCDLRTGVPKVGT